MINKFLYQSSKRIVLSQLQEKFKLYLLEHITEKAKEEIKFNISQYIKSIQNSSIEIETSKSDLDKFVYKYEYLFNTLGIKLSSQEQNSILQAINQKYLEKYPQSESKSLANYISRPSKNVWQIISSSKKASWLSSISAQTEVEELFIDYILDKISEV